MRIRFLLAPAILATAACSQSPPPAATAQTPALPAAPLIAGAHFHHIHINAVDPAASIAYYLKYFDAKPAKFAGLTDAVWAQKSWLLFSKVPAKASTRLNTAIWHIGWGAPDPKQTFKHQTELGNTFFQPLTDISTIIPGRTPDAFYFMYVASPDRTLIELNTAASDDFGHLHLLSADASRAADFYARFFGAIPRGGATPPADNQRTTTLQGSPLRPSASLMFDNVNVIIFPVGYAKAEYPADWVGVSELQPTRGTVNDHIGISVPSLDEALKVMRANGVKVTAEPVDVQGKLRYAFVEGPDRIGIELIEDHTGHPPEES